MKYQIEDHVHNASESVTEIFETGFEILSPPWWPVAIIFVIVVAL